MRTGPRLAAAALAAVLAGCAPVHRAPGPAPPELPSPLAGPGVPPLGEAERAAVAEGWRAILEGRTEAALAASRRAGAAPPAVLLAHEAAYLDGATGLVAPLRELAGAHPRWAAAWVVLSFAAEREDDEATALRAAERAAALWPAARWRRRAAGLRRRLVDDRVEAGRRALAAGDPAAAVEPLRRAAALNPAPATVKLLARALAASGALDEAERTLSPLLADPEVLALAADVAARRGDWTAAMERYRRLPAGWPGRERGLAEAQLRWRLENLPGYVHEALASPHVTRAQLAVLVVAVVPEVESVQVRPAPLLPDVVGHPAQREILAVVRAGVLDADPVAGTFGPDRPADAATVRRAVERLAAALGRPAPAWCPGEAGCLEVPDPPTGEAVADALLGVQGLEVAR